MSSLREAAVKFFQTLDRLGIICAVGGSLASSLHGIARATQNIGQSTQRAADSGNRTFAGAESRHGNSEPTTDRTAAQHLP
jgi:hypothetical protein